MLLLFSSGPHPSAFYEIEYAINYKMQAHSLPDKVILPKRLFFLVALFALFFWRKP
jgi:hypothetical protein